MKYLLATTIFIALSLAVSGERYSFAAITANDSGGSAGSAGESQFILDISPTVDGQANLLISNSGPILSVISSIHFDVDPALNLHLEAIQNGSGVDFAPDQGNPKNLPAGNGLDSPFISDLTVTARNPGPIWGINPYEDLNLLFSYDTTYDLITAISDESLRIGLHVQAFAGGYSESFINKDVDTTSVPEPESVTLTLVGAFILRRFRRN